MRYHKSDILRAVRVAMDYDPQNEQLAAIGDTETLEIDTMIADAAPRALLNVLLKAPISMLGSSCKSCPAPISFRWLTETAEAPYGCAVDMPDDFVRLYVVRMGDWKYGVSDVITTDDVRYALQFSSVPGLRGNPDRPVVALVPTANGNTLELFGSRSRSVQVSELSYVPLPRWEEDALEMYERLHASFVMMCASLVAASLGDYDKSKYYLSLT